MRHFAFDSWEERSAAHNMALDAHRLHQGSSSPSLRIYGWRPASLSLGRFQKIDADWIAKLQAAGLGVTRRGSGGGAILHAGELTYSLIARYADFGLERRAEPVYRLLHRAWMDALAQVAGVDRSIMFMREEREPDAASEGEVRTLCFTRRTAFDVLVEIDRVDARDDASSCGAAMGVSEQAVELLRDAMPDAKPLRYSKLIGSAQRRRGEVFLQHGSIKLARSPVAPWVASLADLAAGEWSGARHGEALASAFASSLGWKLGAANADREELAAQIAHFESANWILHGKRG